MTDPNQPSSAREELVIQITPVPRATSEKYQLSPTPDLDSPTGVRIPGDIADAIALAKEEAPPKAT